MNAELDRTLRNVAKCAYCYTDIPMVFHISLVVITIYTKEFFFVTSVSLKDIRYC